MSDRGVGAVTMEGLAARARVSKALPYKHFDNAEAVLAELYHREMTGLGAAVVEAIEDASGPEDMLRAAIGAYFDIVIKRGAVLAALSGAGSEIPKLADVGERIGNVFLADLLVNSFGLTRSRARVVAALLLGALLGAVEALAHGEASRQRLEEASVGLAMHLVNA